MIEIDSYKALKIWRDSNSQKSRGKESRKSVFELYKERYVK